VEQEAILLTISRFHGCTYCMAAHSMIAAKMSKVPQDVLEVLRSGGRLSDEKLEALSRFTEVMLEQRGRPASSDLKAFEEAGYSDRHVLEIILAIAVKTISNYSNHVLHTQVDAPFHDYAWSAKQHA
jgi:AhpD family alkylhydroperoxidase